MQTSPGHRGAGSPIAGFAVAQVEPAFLVQREIEQATLTLVGDGGQARDRMTLALGIDTQQTAGALTHQQISIGQEGQPPGVGKIGRNRRNG
ncbi:hypothetical protein D3C79_798900 [compost metagenome]